MKLLWRFTLTAFLSIGLVATVAFITTSTLGINIPYPKEVSMVSICGVFFLINWRLGFEDGRGKVVKKEGQNQP